MSFSPRCTHIGFKRRLEALDHDEKTLPKRSKQQALRGSHIMYPLFLGDFFSPSRIGTLLSHRAGQRYNHRLRRTKRCLRPRPGFPRGRRRDCLHYNRMPGKSKGDFPWGFEVWSFKEKRPNRRPLFFKIIFTRRLLGGLSTLAVSVSFVYHLVKRSFELLSPAVWR